MVFHVLKKVQLLDLFLGPLLLMEYMLRTLDISRWDHKDFKVFYDDILQLVRVIYILYLYECKYQNIYDICMIVRFNLLNIIVGEILVST